MSTRGYIYVAMKKQTMGQRIKFDISKCNLPVVTWDHERKEYIPFNTENFKESQPVTKPFVGAYCGADCYLTGAGSALLKYFNSYEKAVNLVAAGMSNSLYPNAFVFSQKIRQQGDELNDESLKGTEPIQGDAPEYCDACQYLYYEGRWFVRTSSSYWYDLQQIFDDCKGWCDTEIDHLVLYTFENIPEWDSITPWSSNMTKDEERAHMESYDRYEKAYNTMLPVGENVHRLRIKATQHV